MKSILLVMLSLLIGTVIRAEVLQSENSSNILAPARQQWVRQSPLPTGRNLTGVSWATTTHGLASGEALTLVETFDGGVTWRDVNLGSQSSSSPFYNVLCKDSQNYFVIGNSATSGPDIFRTTNSGTTWQRITQFPLGGSWYHIDFVSPTVGFMGSNGAAVSTTDSGATWRLASGYPSCPVMYGMDFRDALVGLCGGDRVTGADAGPGIFKTTDAGVTWVRKFSQSANDVLWLDTNTAIAIVGVSIYRSTNQGDTWSQISSQIFTGLDEMALLPSGTIVGVSLAGDGWRSTDGGVNWTRTLEGVGSLPASWNVSFFDDQVGTIVGQSGYIFQSSDGGLSWTPLNSGIGGVEFYDLEMLDDNTGLTVGGNGYYLRTTNGGAHWDSHRLQVTGITLDRDESLHAVDWVDQDFMVTAGNDGVVYKSFDGGVTWQSIGYPNLSGELDITDVKFLDHNLGYVVGSRYGEAQNMFRTTDGGRTWQLQNIATQSDQILGLHALSTTTAFAVGAPSGGSPSLYRTKNGGTSWSKTPLPADYSLSAVFATPTNNIWTAGYDGVVLHNLRGTGQ